MKKFKINLAIAIIIMQVIGYSSSALSMTLNREEEITNSERSQWRKLESFGYVKDSIDGKFWLNSIEDIENSWQENLSNNCLGLGSCQQQEEETYSTSISKLNIFESLQALKINGERDESLGIGYVPILAQSELGDIYKGVYDYDINLDRDSISHALFLSVANDSLNFFINSKKVSHFNHKKADWNSFKKATALKYDSSGGIEILSKGKNPKINNKITFFKILPFNYSGVKFQINNYSGKLNYDLSKNSKITKPLPKYQVAYSLTDRYQSQEALWQQQIDRKLEFKKQQLANQQRQFRIKMEQTIERNYREQQRQQEILTERTMQELRQELTKQQQQQLQPIRNYY